MQPLWIQVKINPASLNHSRSKIVDYCNQMQVGQTEQIFFSSLLFAIFPETVLLFFVTLLLSSL